MITQSDEKKDTSESRKEEPTGQTELQENAETLQVGLENNSNDIKEHQLSTFKNRLKKQMKKEIP